ncbi:hypothetical protein [Kitasatospora fiedleri]|uniref:hypothetical protein n=1 Tax=Kitasatospora fiedleri TaxID=2991545 RepID=UPI00249A95CB|nr:hypothetical protein [Kitasatospora fiedleri]
MSKTYRCTITADYYDDKRRWELRWHDGPTAATVVAAVGRQLPEHREVVSPGRRYSDEAMVLAAIRLYAAGRDREYYGLDYAAARFLEDVADPMSTATAREAAMVERALDASAGTNVWGTREWRDALNLLTRHGGIGWLLESQPPGGEEGRPEADAPSAPALAPLKRLTARYARGEDLLAWRKGVATMSVRTAVDAVLADPEAYKDAAVAALELVPLLQVELDARTADLIDRVRFCPADHGRSQRRIAATVTVPWKT